MSNNNLIKQLQKNHELLLSKITSIESSLNQKHSSNKNFIQESNNNKNNLDIDNEKQSLIKENENLRNEIKLIQKRLIDLEIQVKGNDNVVTINDVLNDIVNKSKDSISPSTISTTNNECKSNINNETKITDTKCNETKPVKDTNKNKNDNKNKGKNENNKQQEPEKAIDASRLDLRVGKIIGVKKHPDADSLYVEQIDCGEDKPRTVVSGLVKFVPLEEMQNRMVVLLCNLKPAKMRGIVSEAMVMCASTPDKVEVLSPPEGSIPGDRITFSKYPGQPDQQLNPKKKIWEQIAPDLSTNDNLEATYKGDQFVIEGKGTIKAMSLKNVAVK